MDDAHYMTSVPKLKKIIKQMPKEGLVDLLTAVVTECVKKKVFGNRRVFQIAETIEAKALGLIKNSPNQSPMPSERSRDAAAATQAALLLNSKK